MADPLEVQKSAAHRSAPAPPSSGLHTRTILRIIFVVLVVAGVVWMLYALEGVILLVILSIFFAYLVAPLVDLVRRPFKIGNRARYMPPGLAIGIVYVGIFVTIGVTAYTLSPLLNDQINEFKTQKSNYLTSAKARAQKLNDLYQRARIPPQVRKTISEYLDRKINSIGDYTEVVIQAVLRVLGFIPWMFLVPILAFFFLKDVDSFRRSALSLLPSGRLRWRGDEFFQDINTTLAAFTRAQLTACLLIGIICSIGFSLIGVPYALLFGVLAGFFEFVPLVGPLVLAILVAAISSFHSSTEVFVVLVFLGGLRIVHDYFVYPRIIGQGIHLHPLAIILAILSGAELGGIVGIFLAVPVVAVATVSYKHWQEHRGEGLVVHLLTDEETGSSDLPIHPSASTTPEEMARARPDLLSGELKRPSRS